MSPFLGPNRAALLALLGRPAEPRLPITLGQYQPQAVIRRDGDRWLLLPLVMDDARAAAAGREALARGENWMPEHTWQFLGEGAPLIDVTGREAFLAALKKIRWTFGGRED